MSRRRTVVPLIILGGLCAALLELFVSIEATETLDWLRKQVWYTPVRLGVAIFVVAVVGVAIAVRQFLVTAHDRAHGSFSAAQLKRNRLQMIAKIRHDWIEGVLNQFPYQVAKIDVKLQDRPDLVQGPLTVAVLEGAKPPRTLPRGIKIKTVFDAHAGVLLILGAPGSGKTTILLELAEELLDIAEKEKTHPIPVPFNLSSWAARRLPLADWLADELESPLYGVSRKLAEHWITSEQIVPLLDGLDEVTGDAREGCAEAINKYRSEHGLLSMAVCSRSDEYQNLTARLKFPSAVAVQPLKRLEVEEHFDRNKEALVGIRTAVERDPALWQLLDNPLMLSVATVAYQEVEKSRSWAGGDIEHWREWLFAKYVAAMFRRRDSQIRYSPKQTKHWLSSLACILARNNQAILYLENLDFQWLSSRAQRGLARVGLVFFSALVGGLVGGLIGKMSGHVNGRLNDGLSGGLLGGLVGTVLKLQPVEKMRFRWVDMSSRSKALGDGFRAGLLVGLLGLIFWLLFGLVVGLRALLLGERFGGMAGWLSDVLGGGPFAGLLGGLLSGLLVGLLLGLILGLVLALFVWLTRSFTSEAIQKDRSVVNEGTHRSINIALLSGTIFWLSFSEIGAIAGLPGTGMSVGLIGGLLVGLLCGGLFALKHLVLRLLLWTHGSAPLRYVAFLARAKELLFLHQVGGGYIFVHRMFLEYFVSLEEPRKISTRE